MSGNIRTIIANINSSCDNLEFGEARRLIEFNLQKLLMATYYNLLNSNARALVKQIHNEHTSGEAVQLTRLELLKLNDINRYCQDFDISMLKRTLKDSIDLIHREEAQKLLSDNTKYILQTMGALLIENKA